MKRLNIPKVYHVLPKTPQALYIENPWPLSQGAVTKHSITLLIGLYVKVSL